MLYDDQPIVDYFRRIDQHRIMGAMTIRGDERIYFFELKRLEEPWAWWLPLPGGTRIWWTFQRTPRSGA